MCIAAAGELIEKNGRQGKVNIRGNILPCDLSMVEAQIGDCLLVHAGCAITVLERTEKEELDELYALMEEDDDEIA